MIFVPARTLKSSSARWPAPPTPEEPPFSDFGFGERDELLHRLDRYRRMNDEDVRRVHRARHGREILQRIERQIAIERRIDRERGDRAHEDRVAVGRRFRGELRRDIARGAGTVVDDHLLAEPFAQLRRQRARRRVRAAARRETDQHADRFGRDIRLPRRCTSGAELASAAPRSGHDGSSKLMRFSSWCY